MASAIEGLNFKFHFVLIDLKIGSHLLLTVNHTESPVGAAPDVSGTSVMV